MLLGGAVEVLDRPPDVPVLDFLDALELVQLADVVAEVLQVGFQLTRQFRWT
jgi:hypothetical protein